MDIQCHVAFEKPQQTRSSFLPCSCNKLIISHIFDNYEENDRLFRCTSKPTKSSLFFTFARTTERDQRTRIDSFPITFRFLLSQATTRPFQHHVQVLLVFPSSSSFHSLSIRFFSAEVKLLFARNLISTCEKKIFLLLLDPFEIDRIGVV